MDGREGSLRLRCGDRAVLGDFKVKSRQARLPKKALEGRHLGSRITQSKHRLQGMFGETGADFRIGYGQDVALDEACESEERQDLAHARAAQAFATDEVGLGRDGTAREECAAHERARLSNTARRKGFGADHGSTRQRVSSALTAPPTRAVRTSAGLSRRSREVGHWRSSSTGWARSLRVFRPLAV